MKTPEKLEIILPIWFIFTIILVTLSVSLFFTNSGIYRQVGVLFMFIIPLCLLLLYIFSFIILFRSEKMRSIILAKIILLIPIILFIIGYVCYIAIIIISLIKNDGVTQGIFGVILSLIGFLIGSFIFLAILILLGYLIISFEKDKTTISGKVLSIIFGIIVYGATLLGSLFILAMSQWRGTYGTPIHRPKVK